MARKIHNSISFMAANKQSENAYACERAQYAYAWNVYAAVVAAIRATHSATTLRAAEHIYDARVSRPCVGERSDCSVPARSRNVVTFAALRAAALPPRTDFGPILAELSFPNLRRPSTLSIQQCRATRSDRDGTKTRHAIKSPRNARRHRFRVKARAYWGRMPLIIIFRAR